MITIRRLDTGKKEVVTRNVAHDLVERGLAEVVRHNYRSTAIRPSEEKKYQTK